MNKLHKALPFVISLMVMVSNGYAQQDTQWVPTVDQLVTMPASPEAAAFAQYGKTPVSYYNGTPSISIPIAVLQGRSLEVPITLTYDASGIKVEQIATWIGLGWNLNVGGTVTRQVNGLPDDYLSANPVYYPHYSDQVYSTIGTNPFKKYYDYFLSNDMTNGTHTRDMLKAYGNFIAAFEKRKVDTQPDTYSFSVMGLSGSFYIDYSNGTSSIKKAVSIDNPDLDIEVTLDDLAVSPGVKQIYQVTITDKFGTRYIFQNREVNDHYDMDAYEMTRQYHSAWYLTWIKTANDRDVVHFNYDTPAWWTTEQYMGRGDVLRSINTPTADCPDTKTPDSSAEPVYRVKQFNLQSITVNGITRANFYTAARDDLSGKKRLSYINLYKKDQSSENEIHFDNDDYFGSGTKEKELRLKLNGISFWGANGSAENDDHLRQDYSFEYLRDDSGPLPSRESMAQDYWGFYNGRNSNTSLITGNRSMGFDYMKQGTLNKVTYPSGGHSTFHYQPNYIDNSDFWIHQYDASSTNYEKVTYESNGLDGEIDTSDPAGYMSCEDVTTAAPSLAPSSFRVTETGVYSLELSITEETATSVDHVMHVFLYEGSEQSFCDLVADYASSSSSTSSYIHFYKSYISTTTLTETIYLDKRKTYRTMIVSNADSANLSVYRKELKQPAKSSGSQEVGGLRVYKIVDHLNSSEIANTRYFYYDDLSLIPSGTDLTDSFFSNSKATSGVMQLPVNTLALAKNEKQDGYDIITCTYINRYSTNQYRPVSGIVSYSTVTEVAWSDQKINGFTVYDFYNANRSTMRQTTPMPSTNGNIKTQSVYDQNLQLIQKTENQYSVEPLKGTGGLQLKTNMYGYFNMVASNTDGSGGVYYKRMSVKKFGSGGSPIPQPCHSDADCLNSGPQNIYEQETYGIGEGWLKLDKTTVTRYDGATPVSVTTENFYDSPYHYELTSTQTTDSKGNTLITYNQYPGDISDSYMSDLESAHRTGEVVNTTVYRKTGSVEKKLKAQYTKYTKAGDLILPGVLQYALGENDLEDRIQYKEYDDYGNPVLLIKDGIEKVKLLWGYNSSRPIARITGLANEYLAAHTSFETAETGQWVYEGSTVVATDVPTGNRYYNLPTGSISCSSLDPNRKYVVSYWAKDGTPDINGVIDNNDAVNANASGWKYYEKVVSGVSSVTISGTGSSKLDELRLYPKGALMTTMTYDSRYGITSQTTPNGITTYYEYDDFGRLTYVKDKDGNVVGMNEYQYQVEANKTGN